jgi:hypothetical protein
MQDIALHWATCSAIKHMRLHKCRHWTQNSVTQHRLDALHRLVPCVGTVLPFPTLCANYIEMVSPDLLAT